MADAVKLTRDMDQICAGRSSRLKLALLDFRGTPIAVDVRRVVETGITPRINTGILHVSDGSGQVGAGVAVAPVECFRDALLALDRKLAWGLTGIGARPIALRRCSRCCGGSGVADGSVWARRRRSGLDGYVGPAAWLRLPDGVVGLAPPGAPLGPLWITPRRAVAGAHRRMRC